MYIADLNWSCWWKDNTSNHTIIPCKCLANTYLPRWTPDTLLLKLWSAEFICLWRSFHKGMSIFKICCPLIQWMSFIMIRKLTHSLGSCTWRARINRVHAVKCSTPGNGTRRCSIGTYLVYVLLFVFLYDLTVWWSMTVPFENDRAALPEAISFAWMSHRWRRRLVLVDSSPD